jgi:O-antigen ligase
MPIYGGSKPGDFHTIHFIEILTFLDLSLSLRLLIHVCKNNKIISVRLQKPLVLVIFVYWLIALLSLSTVCPSSQMRALIWPEPLEAYSFIGLTEEAYMYSWHSWFILTESLLLGIALYNIPTSNKNWSMRWVCCLLAGLLASLVLGVLDFYSLIDLTAVRPAFHLKEFGAAFRFERLSSLFGHPGWFAQFVTLTTPAVLAILSFPLPRRSLLFVMIGVMALTEFTLILVFQRGGWVSYPLTLLAVWFCIYVFDTEHQSASEIRAKTKGAIRKILISVPVTIIISFSLIYIIGQNTTTEYSKVNTYLERAKNIQNTQDRLAYWVPTMVITKLHPILGAGNESYSFEYIRLCLNKDSPYALTEKENRSVMAGSAHNLYFQTLAGKGWLGLVSLLALMLVSIRTCWSLTFSQSTLSALTPLSNNQRLLVMMGFTYTIALMIYSNVGEIFYVPINYIVFIIFYALIIRDVPQIRNIAPKTTIKILLGIVFFFMLHLLWEYGYPSAIRDKLKQGDPSGCYPIEGSPIDAATQFRWCSRRFAVNVPLTMIDSKPYAMLWLAPQLPAHRFPFQVKVFHKGKLLIEQTLARGGLQRILAALPMETLNVKPGLPVNDYVSLEVITNDSFIPFLETNGGSSDIRNLSVQWFFNHL